MAGFPMCAPPGPIRDPERCGFPSRAVLSLRGEADAFGGGDRRGGDLGEDKIVCEGAQRLPSCVMHASEVVGSRSCVMETPSRSAVMV